MAQRGTTWRGAAAQGLQTAARSFYGGSLLLSSEGRCGRAPLGAASRGPARIGLLGLGAARADDLSTEGISPP